MERKIFDTPPASVALFVTCMVDMIYPRVGMATVDLLEEQGVKVVFPEEQTCCGQPAFNSGYHEEAMRMAHHFLDVFYPLVERQTVEAIVAPSGSCVTMTSHFYTHLLKEPRYRQQAHHLSSITFELTEFLVDVLHVSHLEAQPAGKVTYHACCHLLRELGVNDQPRQLLANSQLDIVEMEGSEECCGFGGLFAVKNEPISTAMGNAKLDYIQASGADRVVMCDVSCMTHLQGLIQRQQRPCQAMHIAEVLANRRLAEPQNVSQDDTEAELPEGRGMPRRWQDIASD